MTYAAAAVLWLGMLVHIVLSFAFVGGQVNGSDEPLWQGLVEWPLLDMPAWPVVGITLIGVGAAFVVARTAPVAAVAEVDFLSGLAIAFVIVPVLVAGMFPAADGLPVPWAEGVRMGWHLVAAPLGIVAMIALRVRVRALKAQYLQQLASQVARGGA